MVSIDFDTIKLHCIMALTPLMKEQHLKDQPICLPVNVSAHTGHGDALVLLWPS